MSNNSVIAGSVVIAVLLWAQGGSTQNRPSAPAIPAAPTNAAAPAVAEQADQLLKEMSAYIGSANEFTFHADITFDHVLPSGQKLQFSAAEEVVLKRPGGLYIEWNGDLGARQFWYDGKSVTLYDPATPFYAGEAAPPEVDKMLEQLGRVEDGRGGWGPTAITPFPISAHRTGGPDFRSPALRLASPQGTRRGSEWQAFEAQQTEFPIDSVVREPAGAAPCHFVPSCEKVAHALVGIAVNTAEC